jgi:hypothetical protein
MHGRRLKRGKNRFALLEVKIFYGGRRHIGGEKKAAV